MPPTICRTFRQCPQLLDQLAPFARNEMQLAWWCTREEIVARLEACEVLALPDEAPMGTPVS